MADKLSEVAKTIGQTKKNAETALRRYQAKHPKIDRVRDIFDPVIPFEMEFTTDQQDSIFNLDLYFNKPPPLKSCDPIPCKEFITGPGPQLLNVGEPYIAGSAVVFRDGTLLTGGAVEEYDPFGGYIWAEGTDAAQQVYNVCYRVDSRTVFCNTFEDDLVITRVMPTEYTSSASHVAIVSTETIYYLNPEFSTIVDNPFVSNITTIIPVEFPETTKSHTFSFKLTAPRFAGWPSASDCPSTFAGGHRIIIELGYNGFVNTLFGVDIQQAANLCWDGDGLFGTQFDISGGFDWLNPNNYYTGPGLERYHSDRGRISYDTNYPACVSFWGDNRCPGSPGVVGDIWVQTDFDIQRGDWYIHTNLGMSYIKLHPGVIAEGELSDWHIGIQNQAWNTDSDPIEKSYGGTKTYEWVVKDITFCEREITYT